jgi:hypothetical protein
MLRSIALSRTPRILGWSLSTSATTACDKERQAGIVQFVAGEIR